MSADLTRASVPLNRAGQGGLVVRWVAGQSTATSAWASSPLKLLVPRSRGLSVWGYLSSFGGGMVAGDQTRFSLSVGTGSRCFIGTQASTKIYRNPDQLPCGHHAVVRVAESATLIYAPDPVQCFADSRYEQRQTFHLEPGANLLLVDWLSGGRTACGERWAFSHYASRNEVFWGDEPLWFDALRLDPIDGRLTAPARLGRFNSVATLACFGADLRASAEAMLDRFGSLPVERGGAVLCSASRVRHGALLRVAGLTTESVAQTLAPFLATSVNLLGDNPWARKW